MTQQRTRADDYIDRFDISAGDISVRRRKYLILSNITNIFPRFCYCRRDESDE